MVAQIKMPALSPTMTEGKLSKWLIQKSSKVLSGDIIAEIEKKFGKMTVKRGKEHVFVGMNFFFIGNSKVTASFNLLGKRLCIVNKRISR